VQVIGIPWISRSGVIASLDLSGSQTDQVYEEMESRMKKLVAGWLDKADPGLPVILTAHASVFGAEYGFERSVMLGKDLVLPASLVRDPRLDYVALGHIHKAQDVNDGLKPPAIYPGSIERVDFSEVKDNKYFVIANVEKGQTGVDWRKLEGRRFFDRIVRIDREEKYIYQRLVESLPSTDEMKDAFVRLVVEYPRDLEPMLDEPEIRRYADGAFELHFIPRPQIDTRGRLSDYQLIGSLSPVELLDLYWKTASNTIDPEEIGELKRLAVGFISDADQGDLSPKGND